MSGKHSWRSLIRAIYLKHDTCASDVHSHSSETAHEPEVRQPNKSELGRHANEKQMPRWLHKVLESGDEMVPKQVVDSDGSVKRVRMKVVETPGVVDALARLARADPDTARASFCDPRVHHVAKLRREGSFCGYRNIQMLLSYVRNAKKPGYERFHDKPLPSIVQLQDLIESAWEQGYNNSGRDEIGPIHMTRKFIGTSEVEALLLSLNMSVARRGFGTTEKTTAMESLIQYVSEYFSFQEHPPAEQKVTITQKSPIFLQRPGHSMTIVGIHQDTHGQRTLVVFDPKYRMLRDVENAAVAVTSSVKPQKLLKHYRYGLPELATYDAFEIVHLDGHVTVPT